MAQARAGLTHFPVPGWKAVSSGIAAVLIGILFIVAGVWKITDPLGAAARLAQARVPAGLSLFAAVGLGIAETFAGVLIFMPRFRRWGAWLTGLLLVAFLIYIGAFYNVLRGSECNCFPWIKRAVGPAFFIGDAVMLLLAAIAGAWGRNTGSRRSAVLVLGAVTVFALASYGVSATRQGRIMAPDHITVDGRPFNLHAGKVFLYFFDPECSHCDAAAREMAHYSWRGVTIIGVPTDQPQFAQQFMRETGLKGVVSNDLPLLRKTFSFGDPPFGVALIDGRQKAAFRDFDQKEPATGLRVIGFVN